MDQFDLVQSYNRNHVSILPDYIRMTGRIFYVSVQNRPMRKTLMVLVGHYD